MKVTVSKANETNSNENWSQVMSVWRTSAYSRVNVFNTTSTCAPTQLTRILQ